MRTPHSNRHAAGFSLVELSITLVIIGLLAGGVLMGRHLIRSSAVQALVTQKEELVRAFSTFQQRYNGLPGDLTNATQIWGAAHTTPNSCAALTTVATGTATCNGNGDTHISSYSTESSYSSGSTVYERHRAWQHLANAGLIAGTYTGVQAGTDIQHARPGLNAPGTRITSVGFTVYNAGVQESAPFLFDGGYDHIFIVGKESGESTKNPFLTPEEAWGIDSKFDDGLPGRGLIVTPYNISDCHLATDSTDFDKKYDLSKTSESCPLIFRNLF